MGQGRLLRNYNMGSFETLLRLRQGKLMLQVKWKGYDDPADQTLEPEENLLYGQPGSDAGSFSKIC